MSVCETAGAYTVTFLYSSETFPSEITPAESASDEGIVEEQRRHTPNISKIRCFFIGLPQVNSGLIPYHIQIHYCAVFGFSTGLFSIKKICFVVFPSIFLSRLTGYQSSSTPSTQLVGDDCWEMGG